MLTRAPIRLAVVVYALTLVVFAQRHESPKRERDPDNPRARAEFIERQRGHAPGTSAAKARREAIGQREAMIRQQQRRAQRTLSPAASATEAGAPGPQPTAVPANPNTWTPIGPRPTNTGLPAFLYQTSAGRVSALAVDPTDATGNTVYLGGAQGGVWKTTDGGANWVPLTDDLTPGPGTNDNLAIGAIAVASDGTVYVGTGEQSFSQDSYYGAGILKSTDGGATWTRQTDPAFDGQSGRSIPGMPSIGGMSVRPGSNQIVLAAIEGSPPGVYRTTDGGANWTRASGITDTATAVAFAPGSTTVAFAGVLGLGVFKSTDGGATWAASNGSGGTAINTTTSGRVELAVFDANTLYAAVVDETGTGGLLRGIYKSTNGGTSWTNLKNNLAGALQDFCQDQCWYDLVIAVNPANANIVFAGGSGFPNGEFLQRTLDGGATWTLETGTVEVHADQHAMAFTPDGSRLYLGNDGGAYSTTNTTAGTVTWIELNSTLNLAQFYKHFAIHPTDVNHTIGGTQDNGIQEFGGSLLWEALTCGDGAGAVYDLANPNTNIYVNCQFVDVRRSTTGPLGVFIGVGGDIVDDSDFIPPLIGDPAAAGRLYFGGTRVWRTNNGTSWVAISPDLTGASGEFITAIAVAPSDNNVVYAGTGDGRIWQGTSSGGFTAITNGATFSHINGIAVNPTNSSDVFIVQGGFNGNHVMRRATLGGNWQDVSASLPNTPANDLVLDPDIAGTMYVATDIGVFTSSDTGTTWNPLATGLPNVAVFGLKLHRASRILRAATHGRGMWDLSVPFIVTGPGAQMDPGSVDFGVVDVGSTSNSRTIEFVNVGDANTTISAIFSSNAEFAIAGGTCAVNLVLPPAGRCGMQITFAPSGIGGRSGTLTVQSNAVNGAVLASVSGIGDQPPSNDDRANATVVNAATYSDSVITLSATTEAADPLPDSVCVSGPVDTRNHTVWYAYTPGATGTAVIDTVGSDFDTVLSVWSTGLSSIACIDDIQLGVDVQSRLTLPVTAGVHYLIMVSGYTVQDAGVLQFRLTGPAPLTSTAVDYEFIGPTDTRRVVAGQSLTYNLNLAPLNGYTGTVAFSCIDTTTATVTCNSTPPTVDMASGPTGVTLAVTITRANQQAVRAAADTSGQWLGMLWAGVLAGCCFIGAGGRGRRLLVGFVAAIALSACGGGGGGGGGGTPTPPPRTDHPATIVVTATGTGGNGGTSLIVHRLNLPIIVSQ